MSQLTDETRAKMLSMLKHDINNVLTGVKTGLDIMAMDEFFEDPDNAEDLDDILKASKRLTNMMEDLSLIYADKALPGTSYPSKTLKELQDQFQQQCEQNRLTPIPKNTDPEGEISLAAPVLTRGLIYLTQAIADIHKSQPEYEFLLNGTSLQINLTIPDVSSDKIKELMQLNDDSRNAHLMLMTRQALSGLKAKNKTSDQQLSLLIPSLT